ncbi:phosphatase PAP2 family protein [Helicobacter sp. T3_23-1059]
MKQILQQMVIKILAVCLAFSLAKADINAKTNPQAPTKSAPNIDTQLSPYHTTNATLHQTTPQAGHDTQESKPSTTKKDKDTHFFGYISPSYMKFFSNSMQFLPAAGLSYALIIKDFLGFRQQAIGWVAVVGATYAVKYLIYFAAPYAPNALSFAKRPRWQSYEAFPSGHTSSAFAAVGFLQKRYGSRLGIPAFIVALAVGESRLLLEKHTLLQVVCGGILGFLLSFFCASPFVKIHTSSILPNLPNKHNKHAPQNHLPQNQQNNQTLYSAFLLALFFV